MSFKCQCGISVKVRDWPFHCVCGRSYASEMAEPAIGERRARRSLKGINIARLVGNGDPTLLGNRIAALTAAVGIPPCGGCEKRRAWLNKAHAWLRGKISGSSSDRPAADG
jgi:hypothetical protein